MSPKPHKQLHYNVALVDKLWNLKRLCEAQLNMHIPLNMVLKDEEYRSELLTRALSVNDEQLNQLVWDIRHMEDEIVSATHTGDRLTVKKKIRRGFKLTYLSATACALLIFLSGYLFRSFLPLDAGDVFVLQAIAHAQVKSAIKANSTAVNNSGVPIKSASPLFRLHGSNTVGEKLAPRLVEAYLMARGATNIKTEQGSNFAERTISAELNGRIEFIEIHAHGSSTAFNDLLMGKADLGMASRPIKPQERTALLETMGDLTDSTSEHVIGLDGLAIIVHSSNPITSLSLADLGKIFSGEVTNWQQLGGKDNPITLYARDENSGTWDSFKSLVLDTQKSSLSSTAKRFESSTRLSDSVSQDAGGIGFIGLPYVRRAKLLSISTHKNTKSILPTHFTVSTEDYPLSRRLYLYMPQVVVNAAVEEFVEFSASERGQSIVEDIGLVSQNIKTGQPFNNYFYPEEMRGLTVRSERLSINFRFKDGSDELDSKSLSDLDRLVKYVEVHSPKRLQLFGFSDSEGDRAENKALSLRRAKVVEQRLIERGIYPLVARGLGDEAPLASSNTEEGRKMNRRVEVWIL